MRWRPLAAMMLAFAVEARGLGPAKEFDDSGVRLSYSPHNLWRSEDGLFVGRREGKRLVLVYDFFGSTGEGGRYSECPSNRGDAVRAPDCGAIQTAVGQALDVWGEASGYLTFRRRSSPSDQVNIWIAWTDDFKGEHPPIALSVDNSRSALEPARPTPNQDYQGLERVAYVGAKKSSGALLFNDRYCWFLDEAVCPAPITLPNGKVMSINRSVRLVSLHEAGHVLGFGHFTVASIMGVSGGTEKYELTAYDREAVRRVYARVDSSVPFL